MSDTLWEEDTTLRWLSLNGNLVLQQNINTSKGDKWVTIPIVNNLPLTEQDLKDIKNGP